MPQHLVDLSRKPEGNPGPVERDDKPFFPVSMHLGTEEIKKLGLQDATIGDKQTVITHTVVNSISASSDVGEEEVTRHMTLDVMEAIVEGDTPRSEEERASILFGAS